MPMNPDEERRALLWRQQRERREAFQQALSERLGGNPTARTELDADWEPLVSYYRGRNDSSCDEGED